MSLEAYVELFQMKLWVSDIIFYNVITLKKSPQTKSPPIKIKWLIGLNLLLFKSRRRICWLSLVNAWFWEREREIDGRKSVKWGSGENRAVNQNNKTLFSDCFIAVTLWVPNKHGQSTKPVGKSASSSVELRPVHSRGVVGGKPK